MARPAAKPLVNALLRRYLRERDALNAAVRDGSGRALVASALVDRPRAREYPDDWEAILAAGNERPPLALRVNRRVDHARGAARGVRGRRHRRASPAGEPGSSSSRRGRCRDCPASPRARSRCRTSARSSRRRCCGSAAACACSTPARRPAARPRTCSSSRTSTSSRSTATRPGCARARQSRAAAACRAARARGRRRCRRAAAVVGRPAVRPHPGRRAVHRVGRRAPAPRRQMAAARADVASFARQQARLLDALWPCLAPRRAAAVRDLLGVSRRKTKRRSRRFVARHPDALRETLTFPAGRARGGQLLPSLPARATIRTVFLRAAPQALSGVAAARIRAAPAPRTRRHPRSRPARRHAAPPSRSASCRPARLAAPALRVARRPRWRRCSALALARCRRRRAPTPSPSSRRNCGRRGRLRAQRRVRLRAQPDARGGAAERRPAVLRARVRARRARAGTGSTRRC